MKDTQKDTQLIFIEWEDACIYGTHTQSLGDDFPLLKIRSAGILIAEDDVKITLAMDWNYEYGDGRTIQTYPKSCIKKEQRFKVKN